MNKKLIKIGKEFILTGEHSVRTTKGLIQAKDLKIGDDIIDHNSKVVSITNII